jgi:hypothetical protein
VLDANDHFVAVCDARVYARAETGGPQAVKDLQAFLSARYEEDEDFARSLVTVSAAPPESYALGVTLAQRVLAEVQMGRAIADRCQPALNEGGELAEVKYDVVRKLALAYTTHPDFRSNWHAPRAARSAS